MEIVHPSTVAAVNASGVHPQDVILRADLGLVQGSAYSPSRCLKFGRWPDVPAAPVPESDVQDLRQEADQATREGGAMSTLAFARQATTPMVDIAIPVCNEETEVERSIRRLDGYLCDRFPVSARITIVDNASTDGTWAIAQTLEAELERVRAVHLPCAGRGGALVKVWQESDATVLAYMDVDLSTDLNALLPLVAPLLSGHSDLSIGSRLSPGSRVVRGPKREVVSRFYNLLLKLTLGVRFRDAQCGFKAIRSDVARHLVPLVEDRRWFFDTELLALAEQAGFRIYEVPVDWIDDPDSRVDIVSTAIEDLLGIARLSRRLLSRPPAGLDGRRHTGCAPPLVPQLIAFAMIGVIATAAYAALYWLLRQAAPPPLANTIALLVTALPNTAANRRFTFRVREPGGLVGDHVGGLLALSLALVVTSVSVLALQAVEPGASRVTELVVLVAANLIATGARFLLPRIVILHRRQHADVISEGMP
jgi:putative flippase GtrA